MFRAPREVDEFDIEVAVEAIIARHAMLRARFRSVRDNLVQLVLFQASKSYLFGYHTDVDYEEIAVLVENAEAVIPGHLS
jgi:hypothetical protein